MSMRPAVRYNYGRNCRLIIFTSIVGWKAAFGQDDAALDVKRSRETGLATFVTSRDGGPIVAFDAGGVATVSTTPEQFLDRHGRLFGVSDRNAQLVADAAQRDLIGQTHTKFKQKHAGIPVFSGQLRVHQDAGGRVVAANGDFYPIPEKLDVRPSITAEMAVKQATLEWEAAKPVSHRLELTIVDPGWYGDPPLGTRLAYLVELEDPTTYFAQAYFIDAHSGKILDRWPLVETIRFRQIYDGYQSTDLPGILARAENGPSVPSPRDVNRAFDYYGDTYDYFRRAFGRDSMDDMGLPMVATVNSIAPGCPNAFWSSTRLQMAFCDGTVTDDITAHELTHGLTYFTAQLIYQNQSGQLNESYSDVFGELVDLFNGNAAFVLGEPGATWPFHFTGPGLDDLNSLRTECSPRTDYYDGVRWLMGEDSFAFGGAIRDLWDPTCRSDPDRAMSPLQTCGPGDSGGVHSGSGIPNHAFAMLVDGKQFNGYTVRGIGPIKAGAVWYRALTTYLNPTSDFEDAYVALTRSARDLVGEYPLDPRTGFPSNQIFTTDDALQVDLALRAVEMNGPGRCGRTVPILNAEEPPLCGDEMVVFFDDFETDAPGWTVSNSGPPTPYDWQLTNAPLPYGRPGFAFICENSNLGDCVENDESALHSLMSPPIVLPEAIHYPLLRFTHHIDVETGWDGGDVSVRANGGRWNRIPGSSFHFNPYNTRLRTHAFSNSNPLAGHEAWSGIGGQWGTSVADLSAFVEGGDVIELRFDFGKDGCTGRLGWFVDDVAVYGCPDCNFNGHSDDVDLVFRTTSGTMSKIGVGSPKQFVIDSPPRAAEDVLFRFYAIADLVGELQDESLFVSLNGVPLGQIFASGGSDCPNIPDTAELTVPRDQFNRAALAGAVTIDITASDAVNPLLCGRTSWIRTELEYATEVQDQDDDGIPDECQSCQAPPRPAETEPLTRSNRYLAFAPSSGARQVAYRLRRVAQTGAQSSLAPVTMWLGPPIPEERAGHPARAYVRPRCSPYFSSQWESAGPLFVTGEFVIPGADYLIDAIEVGCWSAISIEDQVAGSRVIPARQFSKALRLGTATLWGDVAGMPPDGETTDGPDGKVDMQDVSAVVDRFRNTQGAVDLHRADLSPAIPDRIVDFSDISQVIDAYRGEPYPYFSSPSACPDRSP